MQQKLEDHLGKFVYGAIDGTVTTFAVVAAAYGAGLSSGLVIILGVANLLGDGFSMGSSAFLAAKAERDLATSRGRYKHRHSPRMKPGETPFENGFVTFLAFVSVGSITIITYVVDVIFNLGMSSQAMFIVSAIMTGVTFISVGLLRSFITKVGHVRAAVETLLLGSTAAALAYISGDFLGKWLGLQ